MLEWRSAMNLLIVDDEYLVVEEVVTVTDWELLGITEIYSATNAERIIFYLPYFTI